MGSYLATHLMRSFSTTNSASSGSVAPIFSHSSRIVGTTTLSTQSLAVRDPSSFLRSMIRLCPSLDWTDSRRRALKATNRGGRVATGAMEDDETLRESRKLLVV